MFLVAVVHEVACLYEISALGDGRIGGGSAHNYLYFPTIVIELSSDYSCVEDGLVLEIKEGFFESITALLSFRPIKEEGELLLDGLEDVGDWFVLVLGLPFEASKANLLEVHALQDNSITKSIILTIICLQSTSILPWSRSLSYLPVRMSKSSLLVEVS